MLSLSFDSFSRIACDGYWRKEANGIVCLVYGLDRTSDLLVAAYRVTLMAVEASFVHRDGKKISQWFRPSTVVLLVKDCVRSKPEADSNPSCA